MIELNKIAREVEDIERDITGKNLGSKRQPWDRMADAIKSIANRAGATLPDKKYSTKKAFIADALEAIADMDFPRISVPDNDVRFIDYDGTVVYSYSADDFAQMTEMPENPDRTNDKVPLTAQGWNYDLEDAQDYVEKYGMLDIGQMYIPSDGKTHMIMELKERLTIPLAIQQTVSEGVTINWGDDSEEETIEGTGVVTTSHTYTSEGEYEITLDVADGCTLDFGDGTNNVLGNKTIIQYLKKLYIGNGVTSIGNYAFSNCNALTSLSLPDGATSIGNYAFSGCLVLTGLTIPDDVTSIGNSAFYSCSALTGLSLPDSVTSIEQAAFNTCLVLTSLTIPDSITSIGQFAFSSCSALTSLTIPDGVTSISQAAFYNCSKLYNLIVLAETPPAITGGSMGSFYGMPSDCTIYVPYGKGDTYKAASGWSNYASQIQELPE